MTFLNLYNEEFRTENDKKLLYGIFDDFKMPRLKKIEDNQLQFGISPR
jgi:hypothetical protein